MSVPAGAPTFERLDAGTPHKFVIPVKLINEGSDLSNFLVSKGYHDIVSFLALLNRSMFPIKTDSVPKSFSIGQDDVKQSDTVSGLQELLRTFDQVLDEIRPDPGPRRFGNVSFRKWCAVLDEKASEWLRKYLPPKVTFFPRVDEVDSISELRSYLLGGFGSAQRLDYGTGHELSFLAFLAGIWKLGGFQEMEQSDNSRSLVLGVVQPYLVLVRKLILTYNLEPAGTHGVWGLDDHSFIPYIVGSAQYGPPIEAGSATPTEGSLSDAPDPGDVIKADRVEILRKTNFYFGAIGFIYDVKKGPFWEHSPTLYDISGVKAGWGKINKGMLKMYVAEVLHKFPVVQHFPLGSLFSWDRSPGVPDHVPDVHSKSQPRQQHLEQPDSIVPGPIDVTSTMQGTQAGLTKAPWAQAQRGVSAPRRTPGGVPGVSPWSLQASSSRFNSRSGYPADLGSTSTRLSATTEDPQDDNVTLTKAPWAK